MERSSFKIGVDMTFFILSMIVVVGILFFPGGSNYSILAIFVLGGFYSIYSGNRNLRKTESNLQRVVHWYTEPRILTGIALLLGIPWKLLQMKAVNIPLNTPAIENVIIVLALLLYLAAGYFFFKNFQR